MTSMVGDGDDADSVPSFSTDTGSPDSDPSWTGAPDTRSVPRPVSGTDGPPGTPPYRAAGDVAAALTGHDGRDADRVAAWLRGPDVAPGTGDFAGAVGALGETPSADVTYPAGEPPAGTPSAHSASPAPSQVAPAPQVPAPAQVPPPADEPVPVPLTDEEPSGELLSEALPGKDGAGQGGGRAWFTPEDMALRRSQYAHAATVGHWVAYDAALDIESPLEELEGPEADYTVAFHLGPDGARLPLEGGGMRNVSGPELGRLLRHRPSLSRLGPGARVRLLACGGGARPEGGDPLERVPFGQDVATETGKVIDAYTGEVALVGPSAGRPARIGVADSLKEPEHRRKVFHPEPGPVELEALARRAGLVRGADRPAERALRWLRAIRREAGADLGWDSARKAELETLMRGAMAWENTRLTGPAADTGPLTSRELSRLLERHRASHPGDTLTDALTRLARPDTASVMDIRTSTESGSGTTASSLTVTASSGAAPLPGTPRPPGGAAASPTDPPAIVEDPDPESPTRGWEEFHREPTEDALDDLAGRIGLDPGIDNGPFRLLTWIRALRYVGFDFASDPARGAELVSALEALAAVENLRMADPAARDKGPLTLDMLRRWENISHGLEGPAPTVTAAFVGALVMRGRTPLPAGEGAFDDFLRSLRPEESGVRQTAGATPSRPGRPPGRDETASPLADPRQYNSGFGGTDPGVPSGPSATAVGNPTGSAPAASAPGGAGSGAEVSDERVTDSDDDSRAPDAESATPRQRPASTEPSRTATAWIDRGPLPGADARAVHGVPVPAPLGAEPLSTPRESAVPALRQYAGRLTAEPESLLDERPAPSEPPRRPLSLEAGLAARRPPRIDRSLPLPTVAEPGVPPAYTDGGRTPSRPGDIPADLPGLPASVREWSTAPGAVTLRGIDLMVDTIAADLDARPAGRARRDDGQGSGPGSRSGSTSGPRGRLYTDLRNAMLDDPGSFFGDGGREFRYTDDGGEARVLRVRARGHGNWERFSDPSADGPVVRGVVSLASTGHTFQESTAYWVDPALPLWPAKKLLSVFFRISARLGIGRAVEYTLRDHARSEMTSVLPAESHLHLDDVRLEYTVVTPGQEPGTEAGPPVRSGFAVRSGLAVRLPASATRASGPGRIPRSFRFDPRKAYRAVTVENHGPVDHIRDWAAAQLGAEPGSGLRRQIDDYFSATTFHRMARRAAAGRIVSPAFFADDRGMTPLGVFTTRVTSTRALLLGESPDAEMEEKGGTEHGNARTRSRTFSQDFGVAVGPVYDVPLQHGTSVRAHAGPRGGYGHTQARTAATGGMAAGLTKAVVKEGPTGLYLVEKAVTVRRAGRDRRQAGDPEFPERTFTTWTLERLSRAEARRLAGWDDGTALRKRTGAGEPYAPAYLTEDHPPTLGMSRVEGFTFADGSERDPAGRTLLEDFADRLLESLSRTHPGLVAPLNELDPGSPRWRGESHYRKALANTLEVLNTLDQSGMAHLMESLTGGGLRIRLRDTRRGHRGYRTIQLDGELTGRRYEGTEGGGKRITTGFESDERLSGEDSTTHRVEGGIEGGVLGRGSEFGDQGGRRGQGGFNFGAGGGRHRRQGVASGPDAKAEYKTAGTRAPHLYSYHLAVTVRQGGYWRLPGLLRGLVSFGLFGTQPFVFRDRPVPLAPHPEGAHGTTGADDGRLTGRVLLSVGDEHIPETDPHAPGVDNPYRAADARTTVAPMDPERARALALATPEALEEAAGAPARLFDGHPVSTLKLRTPHELATVTEEVLTEASGGSWHATQDGTPVHDAATRSLQALALTATADQSGDPLGRRTTGLWATGPYTNREVQLGHRLTLHNARSLTTPVPMTTEDALVHGNHVTGATGRSRTFALGASGSGATSYEPGSGVLSTYALVANPWAYARSDQAARVVRTEHKVVRKYNGHLVPVTADAEHEVAAVSSALGTLSFAGRRAVPRALAGASGRRLRVPGGWLGHLTESSAVELGVLTDGFGHAPRYDRSGWSPAPWLAHSLVRGHPVGTLNGARAFAEFLAELRKTSDLDASGHDTVLRMVSSRITRTMSGELAGGGTGVTARTGRWGTARFRIGGRQVRVRVALVPVERRYHGAGHGMSLKDELGRVESVVAVATRTAGADFGVGTTQLGEVNDLVPLTGPHYSGMGSARRTTGRIEPVTTYLARELELSGPHAEHGTRYELRIELDTHGAPPHGPAQAGRITSALDELRGLRRVATRTDVGELREQIPLALLVPEPSDGTRDDGPLAPVTLPDPTPPRPVAPAVPEGWRSVRHPDGRIEPFTLPESLLIRGVVGADQVHAATVLSVAGAYGVELPAGEPLDRLLERAQDTGLTRVATRTANALEDAATPTMLSGFFPHALGPDGYELPGLSQDNVFGGADARIVLRARPDLSGARLLTVVDGAHQLAVGVGVEEHGTLDSDTDTHSPGLTHLAIMPVGENAVLVPGAPGAGQADGTTGSHNQTAVTVGIGDDGGMRVLPGRHFVFAVPVTWRSTARVHRHIKDNPAVRRLFRIPHGGEQSYETDGHVIVWAREVTARELGLIDDTTFPEAVAKAWDAVKEANAAWKKADEKYWEKRRGYGTRLQDDLTRAQHRFDAALGTAGEERETARAEPVVGRADADGTRTEPASARADVDAARAVLDAARAELDTLKRAAEDLADEVHRVRAGADRLTRWHRLHATEEGRARLGGLPEPDAVVFRRPGTAPEAAPAVHPAYTSGPAADGTTVLTAPDGTTYTLVDVPRDGDSFHHALAEGLRRTAPAALAAHGIDPADAARELRALLADRLGAPDNADLLDALAPDETDTFSGEELAAAGIDLETDTPPAREFEALGVVPHSTPLTAGRRLALARTQLLRSGDADRDTGWDHGAADLLPVLAARTFGVPVTVVRGDGRFQTFGPDATGVPGNGPDLALVLRLDGRHYRLAVRADGPSGTRSPAPGTGRLRAEDTSRPVRTAPPPRPAHVALPWEAPDGVPAEARFDAAKDARTLTGPDGRVYDLVEGEGDGNRFYAALAEALRGTAGTARPPEPGRLRDAIVAQPLRADGTHPRTEDDGALRESLRTATRWDPSTAGLAAGLAARAHGLRVLLVRENGTFTTHTATDRDHPLVVLYERGGEYLAARPRDDTGDARRGRSPLTGRRGAPPAAEEPETVTVDRPGLGHAVAEGLRLAVPHIPPRGPDQRVPLFLTAEHAADPETLYDWAAERVTEADLRAAGEPAPDRLLSPGDLLALGVPATDGRYFQAVLNSGLPASGAGLTPPQWLRAWSLGSGDGPDEAAAVAAETVGRVLGIRFLLVTDVGEGEGRSLGDGTSGVTVLLTRQGSGYRVTVSLVPRV
ncbi:hypothetical protein ACFZAG_41300 [Streptomyces sp. NPDC012403]|uniref:hypothetical protein n=1 Tax=Streptomyces sp. NPDC012403 TaxID=3364831 RepID=UPI0036E25531